MAGKQVRVNDGVTFTCPFCRRRATASVDQGAVIHELPTCPEFDRSGPIEYLGKVNQTLERMQKGGCCR